MMKPYPLRKCKKILVSAYLLWRRKKKKLLPAQVNEIQNDLRGLQEEILQKNVDRATNQARKCEEYCHGILKKSPFEQIRDFVFALIVALAIALLIRQTWFELYEIPTGSMRPTLKEKDRLLVSKTNFGINVPFTTRHFYFDPKLVKRSGIIVFTVKDMDVRDPDTLYFWIFPGKKQYVKRLLGKPGDIIYFYGGRIYGIDQEGKDISEDLQLEKLDQIDHVPFMHVEGSPTVGEPFHTANGVGYRMLIIHQMNEPIARLTVLKNNRIEGEMLPIPQIHDRNSPPVKNYYELWGIGNYALSRIVKRKDIRLFAEKYNIPLDETKYYLELKHHPNLKRLEMSKDVHGRFRPQFNLSTSIIPLDEEHLKALFDHLYTSRFIVKNGYAMRYVPDRHQGVGTHFLVRMDGVEDGIYEYDDGKAYQIKWLGWAKKLGPNHPLNKYSPKLVKSLFNAGIQFDKRFSSGPNFDTDRFSYFREGNLFVMGVPIFKKGEEVLNTFIEKEKEREAESNLKDDYIPFIDTGPPLTEDGKIDVNKIKQYGLLIPQNSYLALGDNYANSEDSRKFGFVPQGNLRGSPSFIFWPPGSRFGPPNQPSYPWWTFPNVFIWVLAIICIGFWYVWHRRYHHLPLKDL